MRQHLIVMAKEPRPGRVKTRLAADIGNVAAAWWVRHQTGRLLRRVHDPRWSLTLAVSPDTALWSRCFPRGLERAPQGSGSLGDRMARLLRSMPPGPVLIVGNDIPALDRRHIAQAFAALGRAPAVLGPAPDGGYWAIGLRRAAAPPADLLARVRWSTEHACTDTAATLPHPVAYVATLADVDCAADLDTR
ncbi:MAG: TIGR04282 family arsenosugar biosynthesis glycosyltransferase [Pseudomonadota bacterium]